jgi:hypothetical protein
MGEEKVGIKPETLGEGGKGVEEQKLEAEAFFASLAR